MVAEAISGTRSEYFAIVDVGLEVNSATIRVPSFYASSVPARRRRIATYEPRRRYTQN
jgi:hypothetical protein